ncbi:prolyl oligopeptidase family serine peptidase [Paenibacillus tarimensis]
MKMENILDAHYRQFEEIKISPDGGHVLVVMGNIDMPHSDYAYDRRNRSIWKFSLDQLGMETELAASEEDAHSPSWSNDGSRIAYISRRSNRPEIWVMNQDGTGRRQLSHSNFPGENPYNDTNIIWSKSGKSIYYTVVPNGDVYALVTKMNNNQMTQTQSIQVLGYKEATANHFQVAKELFESSLCKMNIETGEVIKLASEKSKSFKIIGWLNDDSLIVGVGKSIIGVNPETGKLSNIITTDKRFNSINICDQKLLTANRKHNKIELGHIFEGTYCKEKVVEIPGYDAVIHDWAQDGSKLYVTSRYGLSNYLYCIHTISGETKRLTQSAHVVHSYEQSAKAKCLSVKDAVIFPYSSPTKPLELWKYESDQLQQLSFFNHNIDTRDIPEVRIIRYQSEGWTIEAMLVLPSNYNPHKKYPMLVFLHGGPEESLHATFTEVISARAESAAHYLASKGYAVLLPNFRGGNGYGESFQSEIGSYNIMEIPYRDTMAGVQYVIDEGIADLNCIGIYGSSFGAQLTAWIISQTIQFKGAVGAVGAHYDALFSDRYLGQSFLTITPTRQGNARDEDMWLNPQKFREISPIEKIGLTQTPMLLIETGAERENGWSPARPFLNGLRALDIEAYLIYYPDAFHNGGWTDKYKKDYLRRLVAWFDYCLKGVPLPEWFQTSI